MALNARWAELYGNGCEYFIILPPWCAYVTVNGTASLFHWSCPCVYLVIYLFIYLCTCIVWPAVRSPVYSHCRLAASRRVYLKQGWNIRNASIHSQT